MTSYRDDILYHYGVKGMRWGVRKYQNYDGTLTSAGKKRYSEKNIRSLKSKARQAERAGDKKTAKALKKEIERINKERDYIDREYAVSKLHDARIKNSGSWNRERGNLPVTFNPVTEYRNNKAFQTSFANRTLPNLKTPTGRTVKWVERKYYWNPVGVFRENHKTTGNFIDLLESTHNPYLAVPTFHEQKKKKG